MPITPLRICSMVPRHQCMVYDGAPTQHLKPIAEVFVEKLQSNARCLYLNSPPMVAAMRSYLAAAGVDIEKEVRQGRAIMTSDQSHLTKPCTLTKRWFG